MSTKEEIWVIGTDPPCPRCDRLGQMAHEVANDLNLRVMIRHLAYTDDEARQCAGSLGLERDCAVLKYAAMTTSFMIFSSIFLVEWLIR